jgi:hypothetical protein
MAPFEADVAPLQRQCRQVLHHRPADPAAPVLGPDVDVLEPDPGAALEGRERRVEDRVADRLAVRFDDQRLGGAAVEERGAEDLRRADDLVAQFLVGGEQGQAEDGLD